MIADIENILADAVAIDSALERKEFLERACANRPELRHEVERLVRLHLEAGSFFDQCPLLDNLPLDAKLDPVGTEIGCYHVLEQIGEGGMGIVYMAAQQQPLRRLVALKIIKPGMDTRQVIARFEAERQALALMNHPHIAKVLDAGATQTGSPYFVMELVRGIPITEFCDRHKLGLHERLKLFVQVCSAVQHAHQKGVIHRDLKPTNILVELDDVRAVPKVIDFGIAKSTNPSLSEHTFHTGLSQLVGTPMYMSPEQVQLTSLDVDTRSDIYSLGVLLYELLTGHTPFDKESFYKVGFDEMRRIIREDDPPRPSHQISTVTAKMRSTVATLRGVDERRLGPLLRSELDWIVVKAMEKDRSRRYDSASAFADDLLRYLNGERVLACPPTLVYRISKFARQYRIGLGMSAALFLTLTIGLATATWQAGIARRAEQIADEQRQQAEGYLQSSLGAVDKLFKGLAEEKLLSEPHMAGVKRRLLVDALEFCEKLSEVKSEDPRVQIRTAQAARQVAHARNRLSDAEGARIASQRAISILEGLEPNSVKSSSIPYELALAYGQLAKSQEALRLLNEAEQSYSKTVAICREALAAAPGIANMKEELANSLRSQGNFQSNNHNQHFSLAAATHSKAIEVWLELLTERPRDQDLRSNLAGEYHNLAHDLMSSGKLADAEVHIRNAIREQEAAVVSDAQVWHREFLGNHYFLLSNLQTQTHQLGPATESLERCLRVRESLWKDNPGVSSYQAAVASTETELAYLWGERSNFLKAFQYSEQAVKHLEDLAARIPAYRVNLANALSARGALGLYQSGEDEQAVIFLEKAVEVHAMLHEESPSVPAYRFNLAGVTNNLGQVNYSHGDFEKCEARCRSGLALMKALVEEFPDSREYYFRYWQIGSGLYDVLHETGRTSESIEVSRDVFRVASLLQKRWSETLEYNALVAKSACQLAWQLIDTREDEEAKRLFELAAPIFKREMTTETSSAVDPQSAIEYARTQWGMAKLLRRTNAPAAEGMLEVAAQTLRDVIARYPDLIDAHTNLGHVCFETADVLSAGRTLSSEEQRPGLKIAISEGVKTYRQLLSMKGGAFILDELKAHAGSPPIMADESFLLLLKEAGEAAAEP